MSKKVNSSLIHLLTVRVMQYVQDRLQRMVETGMNEIINAKKCGLKCGVWSDDTSGIE